MAPIPPQNPSRADLSRPRPGRALDTFLDLAEAGETGAAVLRYQPIWSVHQRSVGTYLCELTAGDGDAVAPEPAGDAAPALLARLDRLILRQALDAVAAGTAAGMSGALCVPVHYPALADAGPRREFAGLCGGIAPEAQALLVWEMVGVPEGTLENPLFAMASVVRPHGRSLFMRGPLDTGSFDIAAAIGIHSIGVDLRRVEEPETRLLQPLSKFAERAHGVGLRCHAHGLATSSLGLAAIAAGFDYVSGAAISESTETPWGVLPYDAESLFLHKYV